MGATTQLHLAQVVAAPPPEPGFIGPGHTAVEVLSGAAMDKRNPFVHLMDDRIDFGSDTRRVGEAHPHAGLETVTLILSGTIHDRDEGDLNPGDAVWMTAGRGIIHGEFLTVAGHARVLQLWIRLPQRHRDVAPSFHVLHREELPMFRAEGAEVRLYSGTFGGVRSTTGNYVPVTMAEIVMAPGARLAGEVPASQAGFLYGISGTAHLGDKAIRTGEVGWLALPQAATGPVELSLTAGDDGARLALYLGGPQLEPFVTYGPFVAGSQREIAVMYERFRAGGFTRMSDLARERRTATA